MFSQKSEKYAEIQDDLLEMYEICMKSHCMIKYLSKKNMHIIKSCFKKFEKKNNCLQKKIYSILDKKLEIFEMVYI